MAISHFSAGEEEGVNYRERLEDDCNSMDTPSSGNMMGECGRKGSCDEDTSACSVLRAGWRPGRGSERRLKPEETVRKETKASGNSELGTVQRNSLT